MAEFCTYCDDSLEGDISVGIFPHTEDDCRKEVDTLIGETNDILWLADMSDRDLLLYTNAVLARRREDSIPASGPEAVIANAIRNVEMDFGMDFPDDLLLYSFGRVVAKLRHDMEISESSEDKCTSNWMTIT